MSVLDLDRLPVIDDLPPVDLDELVEAAALLTRTDRKYLVAADDLGTVLGDLDDLRVLDIDHRRSFRYESSYFDTDALASYLGAARRRPNRFKVRTRTYLDAEQCMLEVKVRSGRGETVKHRQSHAIDLRYRLTDEGRTFVAACITGEADVAALDRTLTTAYQRSTLLVGGRDRVTIDTGVSWDSPLGSRTSLDGIVLVETKTAGAPCFVDRALWRRGIRPARFSKYCTGLAALHRDLPANKWHRVLRDRFGRRGAPV